MYFGGHQVRLLSLFLGLFLLLGHNAQAQSLKTMESIVSQAPHLDAFLRDPGLLRQYKKAVEDYYGTDRFQCKSFREVIEELKTVVKHVPWIKEQVWKRYDTRNSVLVMTGKDAYGFRSVARKLHGIWSYTASTKCSSQVCENLFKKDKRGATVLLGRWALVLSGSQIHLVEKNGHYSGMTVLLTPYQKGELTYGLVDAFGNPEMLSLKVPFRTSVREKAVPSSLMEVWTTKMMRVKPTWLAGFLMKRQIHEKSFTHQGRFLAHLKTDKSDKKEFLPVDPASKLLAAHLAGKCTNKNLPANTLFPVATVANELVQISPFVESAPADSLNPVSDEIIEAFIQETGPNVSQTPVKTIIARGNPIQLPPRPGFNQTSIHLPGVQLPGAAPISYPSGVTAPVAIQNPVSTSKPGNSSRKNNTINFNINKAPKKGQQPTSALNHSEDERTPSSLPQDTPLVGADEDPRVVPPQAQPNPPVTNQPTPPTENGLEKRIRRLKSDINKMIESGESAEAVGEKMARLVRAGSRLPSAEDRGQVKTFLASKYFEHPEAGIRMFESNYSNRARTEFLNILVGKTHEEARSQCPKNGESNE